MTDYGAKTERNEQIVADRKAGMTYKAIADKHGISQGRVSQIAHQFILSKEREAARAEHRERIREWREANPILSSLPSRALNCLRPRGVTTDTILLSTPIETMAGFRNLGPVTLAMIKTAMAKEV